MILHSGLTNGSPLVNFTNIFQQILSPETVNFQRYFLGINGVGMVEICSSLTINEIYNMNIKLRPDVPDKTVWIADNKGVFSTSSAWQVFRKKRQKNWISTMTWHNTFPFKMSFLVWRTLRDKIPTESRLAKMGIPVHSRCFCCRVPVIENIDHVFSNGLFAQKVWRILSGSMGIPCIGHSYRHLMIKWWSWKVHNPVTVFICRCLPIITSGEIWRTWCCVKYGSEKTNMRRSLSLIAFSITRPVNLQFKSLNIGSNWDSIALVLRSNIAFKNNILVK